jgi:hypothetical protein
MVDVFSQLPPPEFAGGLVAQSVCHLALVAAGALSAARHEDAQNGSRRATTRDGPAAVEPVGKWPRCGVPARLFHGGWSDGPAQ